MVDLKRINRRERKNILEDTKLNDQQDSDSIDEGMENLIKLISEITNDNINCKV